jgi:hypothetical protein
MAKCKENLAVVSIVNNRVTLETLYLEPTSGLDVVRKMLDSNGKLDNISTR